MDHIKSRNEYYTAERIVKIQRLFKRFFTFCQYQNWDFICVFESSMTKTYFANVSVFYIMMFLLQMYRLHVSVKQASRSCCYVAGGASAFYFFFLWDKNKIILVQHSRSVGVKLGEHVVLLRMIFFFLQLISIFCSIIYVKLLFSF